MRFFAYPNYKPSGLEWLGDLPGHWKLVSLRWVSRRYAGGTPDKTNDAYWNDGTIPWINSGAVNQCLITEPSAYITEHGYSNSSAKWIPAGALVMALAGQGKTKGTVAQLAIDTTCNQSMAAMIPDQRVAARFLFWWLSSQYITIRNLAGGEQRDGLNLDILGGLPVPLLPLKEQSAIADLLDRETAKIDVLVEKKWTLVEKLKEKRFTLISYTVTRGLPAEAARTVGLDSHPRLKTAGADWLGDVPTHWKASKMSRVFEIKGRIGWRGYTVDDLRDEEDGVLVLGATHINRNGRIDLDNATYLSREKYDESPEIKLHGGELLIVKVGATIGKVGLVPLWQREVTINPNVMLLRRKVRDNRFFHYQFLGKAMQSMLGLEKMAGAQEAINQEFIRSLKILVPSDQEQMAIADYLDRETAKIDQMIAKVEEAIERLQEYRSALITAIVTGKINVRRSVHDEQIQGHNKPIEVTP